MTSKPESAKMKHMPGPWKIGEEHLQLKSSTSLGFIDIESWQDDGDGGGQTITIARLPIDDTSFNERVANAHLIAAAPELLAAVKTFISLWPEIDGDIKATPEVKHSWKLAKAAIAKAEGR